MLGIGFGAIEDAAIPVAVFELDAGLSASYGGSGQTWANIVTAPADGSGQTAYDFYRGATSGSEGSDPTFNGSAGANSANEYFSFDGGDYLTLAGSNTTFLNNLHKENAAFTWYGFLETPSDLTQFGLFGTKSNISTNIGLDFSSNNNGNVSFSVGNGSGLAINVNTGNAFIAASTKCFVALSYEEATGTGLVYRKAAAGKATVGISGSYSSPSSSAAAYTLQVFANGNGTFIARNGAKLWRTGMFNRALTEAQLDALFERHKSKLGL